MAPIDTITIRCGEEKFSAEPLSVDRSYLDCRPVDIGDTLWRRLKNLKLGSGFASRGGLDCAWSRDGAAWNGGTIVGVANNCICLRIPSP